MTNKNPWGNLTPPSSNDNSGGSNSGKGRGSPPPDLDEILQKIFNSLKSFFSGGGNVSAIILLLIAVVILWLASGVFIVKPDSQAVILRFGEYNRTVNSGLNYRFPNPIEKHISLPTRRVNRVEIGVTNINGAKVKNLEESLMLTAEGSIIDINFQVQWKISEPRNFIFQVKNPEETIKKVAESAIREAVGKVELTDALTLTSKREQIQKETAQIMQQVLNEKYKAGVEILLVQAQDIEPPAEVIAAFRELENAKKHQDIRIQQAEAYENKLLPKAEGQALKLINEAEAYAQRVVAEAEGDASRFLKVYDEYRKAKEITKKRLYLETMEEILRTTDKVIFDNAGGKNDILPYLPLDRVGKNSK